MAKKELAASGENSVLRDAEEISAKAVLDAFKENDPVAVATMEKVGEQLGGALAIICCVTDPETIVIGGGVSKAGQPLIDCIRKYYREYAFESCKDTPIVIATLGNDAGIYGAAKMVLKPNQGSTLLQLRKVISGGWDLPELIHCETVRSY